MKVFLSWSGDQSRKVAVVFRDWFPSVIQSLVPYVSSEDIDKGARWSTDIAKELEDSTFGILCVTKDNLNAPWLTFEAGALSKTMDKSFVSPFLFNIKRSEVDGPILQFQSTVFEKEDIKKLLKTINKACGNEKLNEERLDKAFEVWYPKLEVELNNIQKVSKQDTGIQHTQKVSPNQILEEILELSRLNQKLLRNPEVRHEKDYENIYMLLKDLREKILINEEDYSRRKRLKPHPRIIEDLCHISQRFLKNYTGFKIVLSLCHNEYPWLYEAGLDLIHILRSEQNENVRRESIDAFKELIHFTFEHPLMREMNSLDNESQMNCHIIRNILIRQLEEFR
jgi:hypothetical protein